MPVTSPFATRDGTGLQPPPADAVSDMLTQGVCQKKAKVPHQYHAPPNANARVKLA